MEVISKEAKKKEKITKIINLCMWDIYIYQKFYSILIGKPYWLRKQTWNVVA